MLAVEGERRVGVDEPLGRRVVHRRRWRARRAGSSAAPDACAVRPGQPGRVGREGQPGRVAAGRCVSSSRTAPSASATTQHPAVVRGDARRVRRRARRRARARGRARRSAMRRVPAPSLSSSASSPSASVTQTAPPSRPGRTRGSRVRTPAVSASARTGPSRWVSHCTVPRTLTTLARPVASTETASASSSDGPTSATVELPRRPARRAARPRARPVRRRRRGSRGGTARPARW